MIISAKPFHKFRDLFFQIKSNSANWNDSYFYMLGRHALLSGVLAAGLAKNDIIAIPSYICSSAYEPLKSYGFNIIFIDVDKKLSYSINDLTKTIKNHQPKALIVAHYFGFIKSINQIVEVCKAHNVIIIEDYSQSFFSALPLDTKKIKADIEIYSIRKSLPVKDGAILRMKSKYNLDFKVKKNNKLFFSYISFLFMRSIERICFLLEINIYGQKITNIKKKIRKNKIQSERTFVVKSSQPSWHLKQFLNNKNYLNKAQKKIKDNFLLMSQIVSQEGFRLLFKPDINSFVPNGLVIFDEIGGLAEYLRNNGIGASTWPANEMPHEVIENANNFPNAINFNNKLVILPIHQDISYSNICFMEKILNQWTNKNSKLFLDK